MKNYVIQKGDTFISLSKRFKIRDEGILKTYHNLYCPKEDIMQEPVPGKRILIPSDPQFLSENTTVQSMSSESAVKDSMNKSNNRRETSHQEILAQEDEEKNRSNSDAHEGKYFIIQKGIAQCNQGFKYPNFKVTSHQKHYWNDADGKSDYLAVTEDDLQFSPSLQPFGQCRLKPTSGGYLPCIYSPSGKWQNAYEKVKVIEKSCLTEVSELMCSTGGKIMVFKHGQQSEIRKNQVSNALTQEQQVYNPLVNFDEFKEEVEENEVDAW